MSEVALDDLLLYVRCNDLVVVDGPTAKGTGFADTAALVDGLRQAVVQNLIERWATIDEPIDLTKVDAAWLRDRAVGARLTEAGKRRVEPLIAALHARASQAGTDERTRAALSDAERLSYSELMSRLAGD
jgi:hypothetical protein